MDPESCFNKDMQVHRPLLPKMQTVSDQMEGTPTDLPIGEFAHLAIGRDWITQVANRRAGITASVELCARKA